MPKIKKHPKLAPPKKAPTDDKTSGANIVSTISFSSESCTMRNPDGTVKTDSHESYSSTGIFKDLSFQDFSETFLDKGKKPGNK